MLSWMFYSLIVSLLMSLAALAFERSVQIGGRSTRWLWALCMVVSVASLLIPASETVHLPPTTHSGPTMSSWLARTRSSKAGGGCLSADSPS